MQASVQTGGRSASPLSRSKSNPEHPPSPAYSVSGRSRKRDRSDKSVDLSSKRRTPKEDPEISSLVDKDGGLVNCAGVDRLYFLMQQDLNKNSRKLKEVTSRRTSLATVIAYTVRHDCLNRFVQLGGLPLLNQWLQEAHKGKPGDGGISNECDRSIDDLILILLQALEKLPVDFDALKSSNAARSVKILKNHTNSKIHRKAKKLIEAWRERVGAEIKQSEEAETASKQENCRPSKLTMHKDPHNIFKNGGPVDANVRNSGTFGNTGKTTTTNNSSSMGEVAISLKKSGVSTKESPNRIPSSNSAHAEIESASFPDERSSNSNQTLSNGPARSTGPVKNTVSNWKEDSKFSVNNAANTKTGNSRSNTSGKGISIAAGVNTGSKEAGSGKPLVRSTSASIEKKMVTAVASDKISNESSKAEGCSNSQKLILRLPNTARSSMGNSFADVVVPSSRDSSANITDRNLDSREIKSRLQNTCTDTSSMKASAQRQDDTEKHVDMPKQRTEMECHSSESHLSFSSTECCTLEFKKSCHHLEGQPINYRTRESLKQTSEKFNGCGTEDVNAGISLLASIAADENMRLEADAALATLEKKNSKSVEIRHHQDMKTSCLTDSENSPMSDITENSGRMEVAPDPDAKDVLENSEYIRPSSDGVPDLEMTGAQNSDLGQSDESMRSSEGHCLEPKPCDRQLEGSSGLPLNDGKSSESQNTVLASSPPGKSLDENNNGAADSKDCSTLREIGLEDKKNPSNLSIQSKSDAATSVNISSSIDERYGNRGGEEKAEMNNDIARESVYRFPGEDALEVAMQVAKEVEEEMESYGKVSLEKENNLEASTSHEMIVSSSDHPESKMADEHTPKSREWNMDGENDDDGDNKSFGGVKEENLSDAEVKETDQTKACLVRGQSTAGAEGLDAQLVQPTVPDDSEKANHSNLQAELSIVPEAPGRLKFDLNEGIHLEDSPHETPTTLSYPIASIPITPVASHPVISSRSSFIPSLQGKGELGWKGSAATSAFRPAEPRKTPERCQNAIESTVTDGPSTSKSTRHFVDFDLNIADGDLEEEVSNPVSHPAQHSSGSRLDLDLNRVDEGDENGVALASEIINNEAQSSSGGSKTVKHDFDLNAGICLDDSVAVDPVDSRTNLWSSGYAPVAGLKMAGEVINLPPWNQPGSTFPSPAITPFAPVKQETHFTGSFTPAYFNMGQGHGIPPFHPDLCRPPAELSSSASAAALPYTSPSPHAFPYAGYPFGYTSTSFPASASFIDSSGSASYSPLATQFLTSGAMLPSHPRPPYLTGFTEIGAPVSSNGIWARPNLDLNAGPSFDLNSGPELGDADVREERTTVRQVPAFGNLFSLDPHMRVLRQSVEPSDSTKKELERPWDMFKADPGPELKNLDARDERMPLRQATLFGNHFSLEEHRVFRPSEAAESLKRKEPEGGWDTYRTGLKQQPQWR